MKRLLPILLALAAVSAGAIDFIDYDYIESPRTAYINTGYVPNSKTELEMEFSFTTNLTTKTYVFGVYGNNGRFQFSYGPAATGCFLGYGEQYQRDVPGIPYNTSRHIVRYVPGDGFYFDGDLVTTASVNLKTWSGTSANLFLGGHNPNGGSIDTSLFAPIRIYYCKIWEDGTLKRDMVPKQRVSDGKSGLYDNVTGNFYCGTLGDFTAGLTSETAPKLSNGSLSLSGGTYTAGASLTNSAANVSYVLSNGLTATTNAVGPFASGDAVSATFSAPTDNTTYEVLLTAENAGGETASLSLGTIYGGTLSLTKVSDGCELGLVPATLTVSRANPDPLPLVVNYSFTPGTAVAGMNYVDDAGSVTIPADAASTTITVTPIIDTATSTDTSLTVSLAAGNYAAPAGVAVAIENFTTPAGCNYWVGGTATGGKYLASTAENWSAGHSPAATENIVFDGDFSKDDCEWDAAASATVASWTQTNGYTGTVTVDTVFPGKGAFICLTVSGNMVVASGSVTHQAHTSANKVDTYRLRLDVGGNLTVASGAKIIARGKGSYGARAEGQSAYGGSYNGSLSWGSLTEPYGVGSSASTALAGGAIWLEVAGATTLDGSINANGISAKPSYNTLGGSGGAVYLKTGTLSGAGTVSANCEQTGISSNDESGAGGRISILLTSGELDSFPSANLTALPAYPSYANVGGAGTVLVRSQLKPNGILFLRDRSDRYSVHGWGGMYSYRPKPNQLTCIPSGQTWVLDEIVFGPYAILRVPTGTTLNLPGGLASISSTATALDETGLLVDGGTLLLPNAETHTISGKWIFEPKDFALAGDLVVTNGAGVGTLLLYSNTSNNVRTCGLSVSGDMHVASGAYLRAVRGGYIATGASTVGGTTPGCHGGQSAGGTANRAYDSFFHPRHPGAFGSDNGRVNVGGGAIRLAVGGTLTLDGIATATPNVNSARSGAAGSIDITAARLEGAGRIEANGNSRNYSNDDSRYGSGGGRIAVRLTGAGETISDAWLAKINAKGFYSSTITADYSSSAGSIYLQNAAQAEGTGTIIVRNTGDTANNVAFTAIPSTKAGGENDDFKKASLRLEAAARVKLFADLRMKELFTMAGTTLDLNGKTFTATIAHVDDLNVTPGVYTAAELAARGFAGVVDSSDGAGGTLHVLGAGTLILVK